MRPRLNSRGQGVAGEGICQCRGRSRGAAEGRLLSAELNARLGGYQAA